MSQIKSHGFTDFEMKITSKFHSKDFRTYRVRLQLKKKTNNVVLITDKFFLKLIETARG